jgi:hypothetical protein
MKDKRGRMKEWAPILKIDIFELQGLIDTTFSLMKTEEEDRELLLSVRC